MALIPTSANSKFHVWINGGALVDLVPNTWFMVGAPTFVGATSLGAAFQNVIAEGITGFGIGNYFDTTPDVAYFTGFWTLTAIVKVPSLFSNPSYLLSRGDVASYTGTGTGAVTGFTFRAISSNYMEFATQGTTTVAVPLPQGGGSVTFTPLPVGNVGILTITNNGGTVYSKFDNNPTTTNETSATQLAQTNNTTRLRLGRSNAWTAGGGGFWEGTIYEVRFTNVGSTPLEIAAIHNAILGITLPDFSGPQGELFPSYNIGFALAMNRQAISLASQQGLWGTVTGISAISATSGNLELSFDAPVVYNGFHSHVPGGTPYDIGTPALAVDAKSLSLPIVVPPATISPTLVSYASPTTITIDWASPMSIYGTANWVVTNTSGLPVSILSVNSTNSLQQVLTLSEHTNGAAYTLTIPASSMVSSGPKLSTAISFAYTGLAVPPTIYTVAAVNPTTFLVTFSEPVESISATTTSNYSVSGLQIHSVAALSSTQTLVTTSTMVPNTIYTLVVSGVRDMAGNQIV
jgi:hypothetical protein